MGQTRAEIIAEAQGSARSGNRLVGIAFTCDEFFVSGDVAVVYSNYRVERNTAGKPEVDEGRAIEVFERRNGRWVIRPGTSTNQMLKGGRMRSEGGRMRTELSSSFILHPSSFI